MSSEEQVFIQVKALKKYFRIQPRIFLRPVGNLKVVENAGHLLPLEQPAEVFSVVQEFLTANNL